MFLIGFALGALFTIGAVLILRSRELPHCYEYGCGEPGHAHPREWV